MILFKNKKENSAGFTPTPILASLSSFNDVFVKNIKIIKEKISFTGKDNQQETMPALVSGFTLIETMVAITIMMMAITSPILLAKQGMVSARQARNSITAFYIAQDAIEYIRNVRDTNLLNGDDWLLNLNNCLNTLNGNEYCQVDTLSLNFNSAFEICTGNCAEINKVTDINQNFEVYDYDTDFASSGFTRNVKIVQNPIDSDEVRVEVDVTWDKGVRSFEVSEILKKLTP